MRAFEVRTLLAERERLGEAYLEFLRVPSLNMGVYALAAGAEDVGEKVHPTEDEVYYVLSGRAVLRAGADEANVRQGDVIFMPAGLEHWFHTIDDELTLLVFFTPTRTAPSPTGP
jgi:quercetin dioxygenase-like cupin family protein